MTMTTGPGTPVPQPEAHRDGPDYSAPPILQVRNLKKYFPIRKGAIFAKEVGAVKAVDDISFDLWPGETLGMVGESGCGKSTTGRAILQLHKPTAGSVVFQGQELTTLSNQQMRPVRRDMQIVFQDPYASLNPRMTVGNIIAEPLVIHSIGDSSSRKARVKELLDIVGLNPAFTNRYPHEFSGGQRQRIGIARALALQPKLIICDEPVSALDVSIQAQVMNRGKLVEIGLAEQVYTDPQEDYTKALLSAVPVPDPRRMKERKAERRRLRGALADTLTT